MQESGMIKVSGDTEGKVTLLLGIRTFERELLKEV